jgi:uncharacterized membrane protein
MLLCVFTASLSISWVILSFRRKVNFSNSFKKAAIVILLLVFVDYAGQTMPIVSPSSKGKIRIAQIFVAVLGASNYTYAQATWSKNLPHWLANHIRTFKFIVGYTCDGCSG